MKTIFLTIASILLLSNISFGQWIDWDTGMPNNYITYSDSTKLTFDSGNGRFSGKYELLSDGRTLTYEVTMNMAYYEYVHEFSILASLDEFPGTVWWDVLYAPYPYFGSKTFSGSYYLDYTVPKPFYAMVECLLINDPNVSFYIFPTYYPN